MRRFFRLLILGGCTLLIGASMISNEDQMSQLQQHQNQPIRVQGKIEGATDQRLIVAITDYSNRSEDIIIDTILLTHGKFDFLLKSEDKIGFYALSFEDNPRERFLFVASQGDEVIYQGTMKHFQFGQVSGSWQDSIFRSFQIMRSDHISRINLYRDSSRNTQDTIKRTYYKEMNNLLYGQYCDAVIQFTMEHPDAYSPLILFRSNVFDRVGKDSSKIIFYSLSPDVTNTILGRRIDKLLTLFPDPTSLTGKAFPWEDLYNTDDQKFVRNPSGNKTLVIIWASWCGPCRQEIPQLKEIYNKKNKDISLVSISLDTQEDAWKNALQQEKMLWKQYWSRGGFNSTLPYRLGIGSIPQLFLLDENDFIVGQWQHLSDIPDFVMISLSAN